MKLPVEFENRMQRLLGTEYMAFNSSYNKKPYRGIRVNTLKCKTQELEECLNAPITKSPFSVNSYYTAEDFAPGKTPAFHAGMFYSQEPSAASAVTVLNPQPGENVLDLCAAPGGKSTQIAQCLNGKGLLFSNEINRGRANILLSNMERMGVRNAVVSNEHPANICGKLSGFFDKVLVDAPCSGEGMFKKEPEALSAWRADYPSECAARQKEILKSAVTALKGGGELVYSTCTFSVEENEDIINWILKEYPEFELMEMTENFGRPGVDGIGMRIYPMDGGEGHFAAKLKKKSNTPIYESSYISKKEDAVTNLARELYSNMFGTEIYGKPERHGDKIIILPEGMPDISGIHIIRAGVLLGELKGKRIEPAHGLFMSHSGTQCKNAIILGKDSKELYAFLHGEEIESKYNGYTAVCLGTVVTGFGKSSGGRLKNKYPKGLRI